MTVPQCRIDFLIEPFSPDRITAGGPRRAAIERITMSHPKTATTGASRAQAPRRRKPWWLWALLALLALALLLLGLSRCGSSDDPASTAPGPTGAANTAVSGPSAAAGGPSAAGVPGAGAAGQGALTAEGTSLLPIAQVAGPNGELTSQAGKTATAQGVLVQSVPADEGFWAGTSETDRVWVQLSGTGESGYVVQQGDRVDFTGQVAANDAGFAAQTGVEPTEGADQLNQQGAHIEVAKSELRRSTA
jgi:hypothetical protein